MRRVFCAFALPAMLVSLPAAADALRDEAIARLAASHDPTVPVAIGCVVAKQAGLDAIREVLDQRGRAAGLGAQWNPAAAEWQSAEARLLAIVDDKIDAGIRNPVWFYRAWAEQAGRVLNAEEADDIADHFATAAGKEQRVVIELLMVGETVMANYSFTGRIRQNVKGAEAEMMHLQQIWWEREPFRVRNFSGDPGAMHFASAPLGIRYGKMLAIQGVEAITSHIDSVVRDIRQTLAKRVVEIDPIIEAFRARRPIR